MVLSVGILILLTTTLNFVFTIVWDHFTAMLPFSGAGAVFSSLNWFASLIVMTGVFAILYKVLQETDVVWKDVLVGSTVATLQR
jgi:uncharacterized BrkB/YihY/UPF0761 family membrane protein